MPGHRFVDGTAQLGIISSRQLTPVNGNGIRHGAGHQGCRINLPDGITLTLIVRRAFAGSSILHHGQQVAPIVIIICDNGTSISQRGQDARARFVIRLHRFNQRTVRPSDGVGHRAAEPVGDGHRIGDEAVVVRFGRADRHASAGRIVMRQRALALPSVIPGCVRFRPAVAVGVRGGSDVIVPVPAGGLVGEDIFVDGAAILPPGPLRQADAAAFVSPLDIVAPVFRAGRGVALGPLRHEGRIRRRAGIDGGRDRRRDLAAERVEEMLAHAVPAVRGDIRKPDVLLGVVEAVLARLRAAQDRPSLAVARPEETAAGVGVRHRRAVQPGRRPETVLLVVAVSLLGDDRIIDGEFHLFTEQIAVIAINELDRVRVKVMSGLRLPRRERISFGEGYDGHLRQDAVFVKRLAGASLEDERNERRIGIPGCVV